MRVGRWLAAALVTFFFVLAAAPAGLAADSSQGGLRLTTGYPGVAVKPGDTPGFNVTVAAPLGTRVSLETTDVPDGWTATLRGGGFVVDEVTVGTTGTATDPNTGTVDVRVDVAVPADAAEGDYQLALEGTSADGAARLELRVRVSAVATGGVTMVAAYPDLRGGSNTTFTYSVDLTNDTPDDIDFGLSAEGPQGWTIEVRPAAQSRAATVTVTAGGKATLTVDVDPPNDTPAGTYPIVVTASAPNQSVQAELSTEVTGNFALLLATADQRLNASVQAGGTSTLALQVQNTGTAPLEGLAITATAPNGWEVAFDPAAIGVIAPGEIAEVTATIKASQQAVAGDYRLTLQAKVPEASDQIELRVAVQTSALWGFVGIGLVVLALAGLGLVFWRLGRR